MSNKNKLGILIVFLVGLMAFLPLVSALTEDFALYSSKKDITTGNCRYYTDFMNVVNTGDIESTYFIKTNGEGSAFSNIVPPTFTLKPGQSQIIQNLLNFPCDKSGTYDFNIEVSTLFELKKTYDRTITLEKKPSFDVSTDGVAYQSCPCNPVKYKFTIINHANKERNYHLSVDGDHKEYASISEENFMLASEDKFDVYVYITEPCYFFGDSVFSLSVKEVESNAIYEIPFYLKTKPCYDFSANVPESLTVCNDELYLYPVTIKSETDIGNVYSLRSDNVNLDISSLFMWGGESASINGTFLEKEAGQKQLNFFIKGERGQTEKEFLTNVEVSKCHSANIYFDEFSGKGAACENKDIIVNLKNDGLKKEKYDLVLTAPTWASLVFNQINELNQNETRSIILNAQIPCNESGKYDFNVLAKVANRTIDDSATYTLEIISLDQAHKPKIAINNRRVNYDLNEIPVKITNAGLLNSTYELSIDAPSWMKLNANEISLRPGEFKELKIASQPGKNTTENTYLVTVTAKIKNTESTYSKSANIVLEKEPYFARLQRIFIEFVKDYWIFFLAGLLLALLLIGLLAFSKRKKEKRKYDETIFVENRPISSIEKRKVKTKKDYSGLKLFGKGLLIFLLIALAVFLILANLEQIKKAGAEVGKGLGGMYSEITGKTYSAGDSLLNFIRNEIPKTKTIVYVNTTGLNNAGNLIKIKAFEKVIVPITIYNNDERKVIYSISPPKDVSWITASKNSMNIESKSNGTFTLEIFADNTVPDGLYDVNIEAAINDGNTTKYTEGILIEIEKTTPFAEKYFYYFATGIVLLLVVLFIAFLLGRKRNKNTITLRVEEKQKIEINPLDVLVEKKIKKKWIYFILLLVLLIFAAVGSIYLTKTVQGNTQKNIQITREENRLEGVKGDKINLLLSNNKKYDLVYSIESSTQLIEPQKKSVLIEANQNKTIQFDVTGYDGKEHDIKIVASQKNKTKEFETKMIFVSKQNKSSLSYYILGVAAIVAIVLFLIFKRKKSEIKLTPNKEIQFEKLADEPTIKKREERRSKQLNLKKKK